MDDADDDIVFIHAHARGNGFIQGIDYRYAIKPGIWIAAERIFVAARRDFVCCGAHFKVGNRSEEHTSELQSLMRISYTVFCLKKKHQITTPQYISIIHL